MQVRTVVLCDMIQEAAHGKSNLLGVFTSFTVTTLPGKLQPFYVFAQIGASVEGELVPGKTSITTEFLNGSGDVIAGPKGGVLPLLNDVKIDEGLWIQMVVKFEGVEVKDYGVHFFSIKQDGMEIESIKAHVVPKEAK